MELRRWTPFTFLLPGRYVDASEFWTDFDLHGWARETYEWTEDPWNGFRDFAQRPAETVSRGRGDCEDFALVAASWAVTRGHDGVGLAFCWERGRPWPTHVIAFDAEYVYSSGRIREMGPDEWVEGSKYRFALKRRIRGT